jgi:hypothetical protein
MSRFLLLAQTASPGDTAARAAEFVSYRFGRVERFDDPRLLWAGVAAVSAALILFVAWQYRRETSAISGAKAALLAVLRLIAFAGAIVFFLDPLKRTDQEVVTDSRVVVLVDASQSMAVEDEAADGADRLSRTAAVERVLADSPLLDELRQRHDVTLAIFDADVRRLAQWKRSDPPAPPPKAPPASAGEPSEAEDDGLTDQLTAQLGEALGAETRLGDALEAVLSHRTGGPLAGVIAFTDGGQNAGVDPLAAVDLAVAADAPLITVGVGSTEPRRNLRLVELIAPSRAYPEDKTVIRAVVQGEGYAGRTAQVELYARQGDAAEILVDRAPVEFTAALETVPVEFELEPTDIGRLHLEARLVAPEDDQYADDNRRSTEMEIVETSSRVLLIASGAMRDYRFLRNQLQRDRHATVDVLLQLSPPGISQDADKILDEFPRTREELFQYDAIVAFDPDWTRLDPEQVALLESWVAEEAGGLIVVAGPVHTAAWLQSPEHAKIRAMYPVEFQRRLTLLDDGLYGSKTPWPIEFTREGEEADFLWLADSPEESRARWRRFPGVFGCYAVKGPKPGAQVYARYSDPEAGIATERPVYFADHFYGAGRVFYMGSGELWRLRTLDVGYFEALYTQLVRHVSQGRLLRGSSRGRLLVERDRYYVGDTVVIRATLSNADRQPLEVPKVVARVTYPSSGSSGTAREGVRNVELLADKSRPGNFVGQFTVSNEGTYAIALEAPDAPGEQLEKRITASIPDLEFNETRRNEPLLNALAAGAGGQYYPSPQLAATGGGGVPRASELLESRAETKIVRGKPDPKFTERTNQWLLGVICGALSLEWLLRRLMKLA